MVSSRIGIAALLLSLLAPGAAWSQDAPPLVLEISPVLSHVGAMVEIEAGRKVRILVSGRALQASGLFVRPLGGPARIGSDPFVVPLVRSDNGAWSLTVAVPAGLAGSKFAITPIALSASGAIVVGARAELAVRPPENDG